MISVVLFSDGQETNPEIEKAKAEAGHFVGHGEIAESTCWKT